LWGVSLSRPVAVAEASTSAASMISCEKPLSTSKAHRVDGVLASVGETDAVADDVAVEDAERETADCVAGSLTDFEKLGESPEFDKLRELPETVSEEVADSVADPSVEVAEKENAVRVRLSLIDCERLATLPETVPETVAEGATKRRVASQLGSSCRTHHAATRTVTTQSRPPLGKSSVRPSSSVNTASDDRAVASTVVLR
jgi:hypothetical protein